MVLGNFSLPGRPTYWKTVGQGTTVLATGTGESYLDIFFSSIISLMFPGRRPYITEILSQRAVKPKNNKPTKPTTCFSEDILTQWAYVI